MRSKLNLGLPTNVDSSELADVIEAVRLLGNEVSTGLGLVYPTTAVPSDYPVSTTISSQYSDTVYCKMLGVIELGLYVQFSAVNNELSCSVGTKAQGFVLEILDATTGFVRVALKGVNKELNDLVVGEKYYLGSAGAASLAGTEYVGFALSATELYK